MTVSSKRADYLARASSALSLVFFVVTLLLGHWSGFFAVFAVSWLILAAALIWFVLCLQFYQRNQAEQEKLDAAQLAADEQTSTIFQQGRDRSGLFAVAQRRLDVFEKWFVPIFSAIIAIYQFGIGLYLLKIVSGGIETEPKQPLFVAAFMVAITFVTFLVSRYATGMSAQPKWKPLRAGGSILLGSALMGFALVISLGFAKFDYMAFIRVVDWVIPILLIILGAETALNVVFDIYRPRLKGQYHRSAFDSRLLGIISEPGEILHTMAGALDYQFGFKVSQTWFYHLLSKAIVPLILFGAGTLYLLSCVVVVEPSEQAIIEHFGNPVNAAGEKRIVGPGLSFKWPWPIDKAHKHATKRIMEVSIGFVPKDHDGHEEHSLEPVLWGKRHHEHEYNLLVASDQDSESSAEGAVPVNLIVAAVPVQYRIRDLYTFIYNHSEPERVLESICYQQLTQFAAGSKIEVDADPAGGSSLLGAGRSKAKETLMRNIQKAVDSERLGLEIVFVGLQGLHPPTEGEVAKAYQEFVGAVQKKQATIFDARAERYKILSSIAGSVEEAEKIYKLASEYQRVREKSESAKVKELGVALDAAFVRAGGDIFKQLREAQSYAFEKETLARATAERFGAQLKAYRAAKEIYLREQRLAVLEEALENIRKYVVISDQKDTQTIIIDVQEKLTPGLADFEGFERTGTK